MSEPTPDEHTARWQSYLIPGTDVLANKLGETDAERLKEREYELTALRAAAIRRGDVDIPRTFDAEHVMATHKHLFQDVYEWAGEYRRVDITKKGTIFAPVEDEGRDHSLINEMLERMEGAVAAVDWKNGTREDIAHGLVEVQGWLNVAHPAREGNGRVQKLLLDQLAEKTERFEIDWTPWKDIGWAFHTALSIPQPGSMYVNHERFDEAMARSVRPIGEPKLTKAEHAALRDDRYRTATADKLRNWNAGQQAEEPTAQRPGQTVRSPGRGTDTGYER